jgi:hypothetical protein
VMDDVTELGPATTTGGATRPRVRVGDDLSCLQLRKPGPELVQRPRSTPRPRCPGRRSSRRLRLNDENALATGRTVRRG